MADLSALIWTAAKRLTPRFAKPLAVRLYAALAGDRDWTEAELELLPLLVASDREAIDVGANIGTYTRALSDLARHVHAFEPDEVSAAQVRARGLPNVTVYPAALSDRTGDRVLHVPIVHGRREGALATLEPSVQAPEISKFIVEVSTLDALAGRNVGFVKIDVEGHEIEVLRGARAFIAAQRPTFLVEVEERHRAGAVATVTAFFRELGYEGLFVLDGRARLIAELTNAMIDDRQLNRPVPRSKLRYVNNFLFLPGKAARDQALARINAYMAAG